MKQSLKAPRSWKLLVDVLGLSSWHTETAYKDGAMKKETQFVKFVYRSLKMATRLHLPRCFTHHLSPFGRARKIQE
nr:uncharacterized protein LOC111405738 isoform X2 [Ipomoea batatas]